MRETEQTRSTVYALHRRLRPRVRRALTTSKDDELVLESVNGCALGCVVYRNGLSVYVALVVDSSSSAEDRDFEVLEVHFEWHGEGPSELSAKAIRDVPIGAVITRVKQAAFANQNTQNDQSDATVWVVDGLSAEVPVKLARSFLEAWSSTERGRERTREDWKLLRGVDLILSMQGIRSRAKFLAGVLGTSPAVMSNRFAKMRRIHERERLEALAKQGPADLDLSDVRE